MKVVLLIMEIIERILYVNLKKINHESAVVINIVPFMLNNPMLTKHGILQIIIQVVVAVIVTYCLNFDSLIHLLFQVITNLVLIMIH